MNAYMQFAEQMIVKSLLSNQFPLTGRSKLGIGLYALSAALCLVSLGFFLYAGNVWLRMSYDPEVAAALTGAMIACLAALIAGVSYLCLNYRKRKIADIKNEVTKTVHDIMAIASEDIAEPIKENPKSSVILAVMAGYVAGKKYF